MTKKTKKIALIGHPVSHSLSPKLHNYWIKQYGIDAIYEAVDVLPNELESTIKRMQEEGYIGCNITHPHKEKAFYIVDDLSLLALNTGAVNTILFEGDRKMRGVNSDTFGFKKSVRDYASKTDELQKTLILGSGGVAKAMCRFFAKERRWTTVFVASRNVKQARILEQWYENIPNAVNFCHLELRKWQVKERFLSNIDLLINATPCGMVGYPELDIDLSTLNKDAVVFDAIYNPKETGLLKQARERGHKTINGFEMFLYQAQASFEIWFGIKPEITQELRDLMMREL